jgi:NAD(P)-dependent dehydrogenase (short-subunit alcohol dehydrogenase family)
MNAGLNGQIRPVTGGTRGIGRTVALAYAGEGARVGITYASDAAVATRPSRVSGQAARAAHRPISTLAEIEGLDWTRALRANLAGTALTVRAARMSAAKPDSMVGETVW